LIIKEKDTVIVTGHTSAKEGIVNVHRVLATVIAVGKYDAFVELEGKASYSRSPFRVSLSNCQKVVSVEKGPVEKITEASIGDLVLSIDVSYTGTKKHIGVLKKIIDVPGESLKGEIEHSTKKIIVPYRSLIILES
tara:strand:+ start:686 stop:1093 length:408 start_codon:yes stop_codon:yes gene_type:complete